MWRKLLAVAICLVAGETADSGAWMRDPGTGFSAVSATLRPGETAHEYETGLYGEYGLLPRLTLGLDLNQTSSLSGHALAFARIPLRTHSDRHRLSLEFGIGAAQYLGTWTPMQKMTLSYGSALPSGFGPGWVNLALAAESRGHMPDLLYKLDATLGLDGARAVQPLLQIETARTAASPLLWSVTPSVRIRGRKRQSWLIGVEFRQATRRTTGVKAALWRSF